MRRLVSGLAVCLLTLGLVAPTPARACEGKCPHHAKGDCAHDKCKHKDCKGGKHCKHKHVEKKADEASAEEPAKKDE
jgi:hypothetical protein